MTHIYTTAEIAHQRHIHREIVRAARAAFVEPEELTIHSDEVRVAVVYQIVIPPWFEGKEKSMHPSGYSDSGADIAWNLQQRGVKVVTPVDNPSPARDMDWVFPDSEEGIRTAIAKGGLILWMNTDLFPAHPLAKILKSPGDLPEGFPKYIGQDLKYFNNFGKRVFSNGQDGTSHHEFCEGFVLESVSDIPKDLKYPRILKSVFGRASHEIINGVFKVDNAEQMLEKAQYLLLGHPRIVCEEYLAGEEVTVCVLPAGIWDEPIGEARGPKYFRPVIRTGHVNGILPHSGDGPLSGTTRVLTKDEMSGNKGQIYRWLNWTVAGACSGDNARAPIQFNCRRVGFSPMDQFKIFEIVELPNVVGPGRPGRGSQLSLLGVAAAEMGWTYSDYVVNVLRQSLNYYVPSRMPPLRDCLRSQKYLDMIGENGYPE